MIKCGAGAPAREKSESLDWMRLSESSGSSVQLRVPRGSSSLSALKSNRPYSNFSASANGKPRWSFAETIGSPSSSHAIFSAGSFHATVRSCSGA